MPTHMGFKRPTFWIFSLLMLAWPSSSHANVGAEKKPNSTSIQTVILISVDGLGQRLLESSHTPVLERLVRDGGAKAPLAETVIPPKTIAGHVSMLTGLTPSKHGRVHNDNDGRLERVEVPTIFDLLALRRLSTHAVLGKEKLAHVFGANAFSSLALRSWPLVGDLPSRDPSFISGEVVRLLDSANRPSLIFAHFALPDTMGHWFQWGSWIQRAAVESVDSAIGRIVDRARVKLSAGSYAIIVTADHGGHGGSHGQGDAEGRLLDFESDVRIPWLVHGAKFVSGVEKVSVIDTAPSIASLLGIEVPSAWNWEGRSVLEVGP